MRGGDAIKPNGYAEMLNSHVIFSACIWKVDERMVDREFIWNCGKRVFVFRANVSRD
jgi:hypothetical protein